MARALRIVCHLLFVYYYGWLEYRLNGIHSIVLTELIVLKKICYDFNIHIRKGSYFPFRQTKKYTCYYYKNRLFNKYMYNFQILWNIYVTINVIDQYKKNFYIISKKLDISFILHHFHTKYVYEGTIVVIPVLWVILKGVWEYDFHTSIILISCVLFSLTFAYAMKMKWIFELILMIHCCVSVV